MIRAVFCDTSALGYECAMSKREIDPLLAAMCTGKEKRRMRDSIASYLMLISILRDLYGVENPRLVKDEYGKPYADGCGVEISLSHRNGVCLIALSDEGRVGADIEKIGSDATIAGVAERYLAPLDFSGTSPLSVKTYFSVMDADGVASNLTEISDIDNINLQFTPISTSESPWCAWCALESTMKKDGRGFGALPSVQSMLDGSYMLTGEIAYNGERYALAVCK